MADNIRAMIQPVGITTFKDVAFLSYRMKKEIMELGEMIQNLPPTLKNLVVPLSDIYEKAMDQLTPPDDSASVEVFGNWYIDAVLAEKRAYFDTLALLIHNKALQHQLKVMLKLDKLLQVEETYKFTDAGSCYDFAAISAAISSVE